MVILRAVWALLAGFAVMNAIVFAVTMLLLKMAPGWMGAPARPRPAYLVASVGYSFLGAAAGGYVTAWISPSDPLSRVLALAVIVLAISAISALEARGRQPAAYSIAVAVMTSIGVLAGGMLRLKVAGLL